MSKTKIGLASLCLASGIYAFDLPSVSDVISVNNGGVSFDIREILGLPQGDILGDTVGPLKYSCELNLDGGNFSFGLQDLVLDKINKTLDFGILKCDIGVDLDKAVCKDQLWGRLKKKGYGLLGESKNKAKDKASEGKEWLKEHVFDFEVGEESAWGKGIKKVNEYCSDVDKKTDEIIVKRVESKKFDYAYNELMLRTFQNDTGTRDFLNLNSGFKDNEKVAEIVKKVMNGVIPTNDDIQIVLAEYRKFFSEKSNSLSVEDTEKSKTYANQNTKNLGFMDDHSHSAMVENIGARKKDIDKEARNKCGNKSGVEYSQCYDKIKIKLEKDEYKSGGEFAKGLNDLKEQRQQSQETIVDLKIKANPKKAVLSPEQINKSAMTQSDKARHLQEYVVSQAKETLEEIRVNNQIALQNELGRLQFEHANISSDSFDVNAVYKETADIVQKAQESATKTVNAIIGSGSGSSSPSLPF